MQYPPSQGEVAPQLRFVRSDSGLIAGVCKGLAKSFDLSPGIVRFFWIISSLWFGVGIGFYLIFAISLPRQDRQLEANQRRILGVCGRLARRFGIEVGLVRLAAVFLAISSFGFTILAYLVLHFALEE